MSVAVGMTITLHPRADPGVRNYRTGLLPQVVTHRRYARFFHSARPLSYPVDDCLLQGIPALRPVLHPPRFPLGQPLSLHNLRHFIVPQTEDLRPILSSVQQYAGFS